MTDKVCKFHPNGGVYLELTPDIRHYGRWNCQQCHKFLVWAKSPKTTDGLESRQQEIRDMIVSGYDWKRTEDLKLLLGLYNKPHLNLKDENDFMNIKARVSS